MPVYSFECSRCNKDFDEYFKMADCPRAVKCPDCGSMARKVIAKSQAVHDDHPTWMDGVGGKQMRECLQNMDRVRRGQEAPIETRGHWKRHLKEHNLVPAE